LLVSDIVKQVFYSNQVNHFIILVSDICIPWYVMTSDATDVPTEEYFKTHDYFGLPKEHIFFFQQV
jgi:UDP-N-acetylglucosamine pyrophosphorylase